MIPEAAVEAAAEAIYGLSRSVADLPDDFSDVYLTWDEASETRRTQCYAMARLALEAAAPCLLVQGWDECADIAEVKQLGSGRMLRYTNPYRPTP